MIVLTIILNVLKHGENALKFTEGSIISVYVKMCLRGVNLHFYVIKLTLS